MAETRRVAILAFCLLLSPVAAQVASSAPAGWWGPTGMNEGWHLRIPVVVTNPHGQGFTDAVVSEDIDLKAALVQAGWPSALEGGERQLQSFQLDKASVRVVEHEMVGGSEVRFGAVKGEVASRASPGTYSGSRPFSDRIDPAFHVDWVVPGELRSRGSRAFMIHLDTLHNGAKPEASYSAGDRAPLDAAGWIGRGTTLVGRAGIISLVGIEDGTTARVEAYQSGKPTAVSAGETSEDGVVHLDREDVVTFQISDQPILVRVTSDKPIFAAGAEGRTTGPVPSRDGSLLGKSFHFTTTGTHYVVFAPAGPTTLVVNGEEMSTSPTRPVIGVDTRNGPVEQRIEAAAPVLVYASHQSGEQVQIPTLDGSPLGASLWGVLGSFGPAPCAEPCPSTCNMGSQRGSPDRLTLQAIDAPAYARVRELTTGDLLLPLKPNGQPSPESALVTEQAGWLGQMRSVTCTSIIHATPSLGSDEFAADGTLVAFAGLGASPLATPVGGRGAKEFVTMHTVHVVALHDATQVTVTVPGQGMTTHGLGAGDEHVVEALGDRPVRIAATKPVVLAPTRPGGYFAGIDESLDVRIAGPLEYRGFLVSLEPTNPAATEPLVGTTGPASPYEFKMKVRNLARDALGSGVADTISLSIPPLPPGWTATLSSTQIALSGGGSRDVTLTITPPADAPDGNKATVTVTATSAGNPAMSDSLRADLVVRATRDVDIWFDVQDGEKSRNIAFERGERKTLKLVVANRALIADDVVLRATIGSRDWQGTFQTGTAIASFELAAGGLVEVPLDVVAPAGAASTTQIDVVAESAHDASAAAHVTALLRIRADLSISIDANETAAEALPGELATFQLRFRNMGSDQVGIEVGAVGALPPGWAPPVVLVDGHAVSELLGIAKGSVVPLVVAVQVPADAARGDRANVHLVVRTVPQFQGDPVVTDAIDLLAIASARHDLRPVDVPSRVSADPDGSVSTRLSLTNGGNGQETLMVEPITLPAGASIVVDPPATLPIGETASIGVEIQMARATAAGTYPVAIQLVSDDGTTFPWHFNVSVPPASAATLAPRSPLRVVAGIPSEISIAVENSGNTPLELPLSLPTPPGWRIEFREPPSTLAPGAIALVTMVATPSADEDRAEWRLRTSDSWAISNELGVAVQHVRLEVEATASVGSVSATIRNVGDGEAYGVAVRVEADGETVDRAIIHRIAPGGAGRAILALPDGATKARLIVESEAGYEVEPSPLDLDIAARQQTPWPSTAGLLVALVALALTRRK